MARVKGISKNPEEARRKIIESALKVFAKDGYTAASTELIAERAGYSQASLFFHFKTKAGLLKACLDEAGRRASTVLENARHVGALELVKRLDDGFDDPVIANFFQRLMIDNQTSSELRPAYVAHHTLIRGLIRDELIYETNASDKDALHAAGTILCIIVGVHASYTVEPRLFSRADYSAMLLESTQLVIGKLRETTQKSGKTQAIAARHRKPTSRPDSRLHLGSPK